MECPICQNSMRPEGNPAGHPLFWCYTCHEYFYEDEHGIHCMDS